MIEKLTKDFLIKFIEELQKEDNQKKVEFEIFNPILTKFYQKISPYVSLLFILYILNLFLIIIILILIIAYNQNPQKILSNTI